MKKGGYQIIDLGNVPFTSTAGTKNIPGVYEAIKNSNGKRCVVSGLNYGGYNYPDSEVIFIFNGTSYGGAYESFNITVKADDDVVVEENVDAGE